MDEGPDPFRSETELRDAWERDHVDVRGFTGSETPATEADDVDALAEFADESGPIASGPPEAGIHVRLESERSGGATWLPMVAGFVVVVAIGVALGTVYPRDPAAPSPAADRSARAVSASPATVMPPAELPRQPVAPTVAERLDTRVAPRAAAVDVDDRIAAAPAARRSGPGLVADAPPVPAVIAPEPIVARSDEDRIAALAPPRSESRPPAESLGVVATEADIRNLLDAYRESYDRLDAVSAAMLWPGVDTAALSRAFATLTSQSVEFDQCSLDVLGTRATALCTGSLRYVRRIGNPAPQSRPLAWTFELDRSAGRWLIDRVSAR